MALWLLPLALVRFWRDKHRKYPIETSCSELLVAAFPFSGGLRLISSSVELRVVLAVADFVSVTADRALFDF